MSSDSKTLAALAHFLQLLVVAGFIPALIIYLIKKDEDEFVANHAKQVLNLQITMFIAYFISGILIFVLIGVIFLIALPIIQVVFTVIAGVKAASGEEYVYPIAIQFIK